MCETLTYSFHFFHFPFLYINAESVQQYRFLYMSINTERQIHQPKGFCVKNTQGICPSQDIQAIHSLAL